MLAQLNERLAAAAQRHARLEDARTQLLRAKEERERLQRRIQAARGVVEEEGEDVEKLEGLSLTGLFARLLGKHEEELAKERKQLALAQLELEQFEGSLAEIEKEIDELEALGPDPLPAWEELQALLTEKERWIAERGGEAARGLFARTEEEGRAREELREVGEAVLAAKQAKRELELCAERLSSAGNWGVVDLMGGGLVTTMIKHGKMDEAKRSAGAAERALRRLDREMRDLGQRAPIELDHQGLERFGDLFFDGLIFDWMTQSKIQRSKDNVASTQRQLARLYARLVQRDEQLRYHISKLASERQSWVAEWV